MAGRSVVVIQNNGNIMTGVVDDNTVATPTSPVFMACSNNVIPMTSEPTRNHKRLEGRDDQSVVRQGRADNAGIVELLCRHDRGADVAEVSFELRK
jgi:hypothetical protein